MTASINSILNVARTAILANQAGVRVTSQNVASAQTEGYSRRTVHFAENRGDSTSFGRMGAGVSIADVARLRDRLLDVSFRQDSGKSAGYQVRQEVLGRVEQVFGEPSEEGLAAAMDAFWASWSDLAARPSNPSARRAVQQRGAQVSATLNSFDQRLGEVRQDTQLRLTQTVQGINQIAEQIGRINREIAIAEGGGHEAHDLRDQRDRLLDDLSQLGTVRVLDRSSGGMAVLLENVPIVDGTTVKTVDAVGVPPVIQVGGFPVTFEAESSKLGELVRMDGEIQAARGRLNQLASALVEQVNALHTSGFTQAGAAGGAFFAAGGTTAGTIRLDAAIAADPSLVVASDSATQSTNNRIALGLAALKGRPADNAIAQSIPAWAAVSGALSGTSIGEYYEDVVTETALKVSSAQHSAQVYRTVADQADARRQSVSGVNTDEELIKLMHFQQAYTAATKVVTTLDEMLKTVLNMV